MTPTLEHQPGEDVGNLVVSLDRDDSASLAVSDYDAWLKLPLYAWQARELIEILTPLAEEPAAA